MPSYTIQGADGQQYGPVDTETLFAWAREGRIIPASQVYDHDVQQWVEANTLKFLAAAWHPSSIPPAAGATAATARCAECGRDFSQEEMIHYGNRWVCAACKPTFVQKLKEGVEVVASMQYAGFWIRFAAKFIDGLVMAIPVLLVVGVMFFAVWKSVKAGGESAAPPHLEALINVMQLIYVLVYAAYNTWFIGRYGATLGKMACGLKAVSATGERISYARACGRHFAEMLSGLICYIGYLMVAFDGEKRALHDHICNTRVIRK